MSGAGATQGDVQMMMSELALVLFAALLPGMKDMQHVQPMQYRCPTPTGGEVRQARPCETALAPPARTAGPLARADALGRDASLPGSEKASAARVRAQAPAQAAR